MRLKINRQEVCATCNGTGARVGRATPFARNATAAATVTQMAGAMRFSLTCPRCEGTGRLTNKCATCHGDGRISHAETVEVRIPPGAQQGSRLRVAGRAMRARTARRRAICTSRCASKIIRSSGAMRDDILITVPVRIDEAGLGTKIEVPTIDGRAQLKIPQGTKNGQKFRMREKGVQNSRTGTRGDQIVEIVIEAPEVHDERTKELLREYATLNPADPRAEIWSKV